MAYPVGAFLRNPQRGEPRDIFTEDDSDAFKNKSLDDIIVSLREARKIVEEHNAKPMAIESEAKDA